MLLLTIADAKDECQDCSCHSHPDERTDPALHNGPVHVSDDCASCKQRRATAVNIALKMKLQQDKRAICKLTRRCPPHNNTERMGKRRMPSLLPLCSRCTTGLLLAVQGRRR